MSLTVAMLAERLGGAVQGVDRVELSGLAGLDDAGPGELSFLANPRYRKLLGETRAAAVLVPADWQGESPAVCIRVDHPDRAFARAAAWLAPAPYRPAPGIHPRAVIAPDAVLGADVHVGACAVVEAGCRIGDRTAIEANAYVGPGVSIGADARIFPLASIRENCRIGNRVRIHNGAVIGSDGYGYTIETDPDGTVRVEKVPQIGIVEIADDVEIGANTTIDRARFGATRIGRGVKIDNLVQIAHNVQIGEHSGIVAQVGVSGSSRIGRHVMLWGQVGIAGHLNIGDGAQVGAQSGLSKDVPPGAFVVGSPAVSRKAFARNLLLARDVDRLKQRVAELEARLAGTDPS